MRFFDNLPYALLVAVCAAVAPLLVILLYAIKDVRAFVVWPGMGLVCGFFAAIIILRSKNLRWSATTGEMMSAISAEGGADGVAISLSVPEIEFKSGRFTHSVSFRDFHLLNRPQITRMLVIDWLAGVLGWSVTFLLFSEPSFALTVTLVGLLAVHVARIAWLMRQRHLALTVHQSIVTIAVGVAAGTVILALAYASSALDLIGWWPVYRNVSLSLALLSWFFVYVDIAIASIARNSLR
ncbi:hypothetical protein ACQR18_04835 [Bradyrhizobium oligotrophicum]|uniref:hypothetical protein n=1 Tax=Bradyrhizobium oligotrophicum TaxID=44255 RepID=UPI003EBE9A79